MEFEGPVFLSSNCEISFVSSAEEKMSGRKGRTNPSIYPLGSNILLLPVVLLLVFLLFYILFLRFYPFCFVLAMLI